MRKLKRSGITVFVLIGLLVGSGVAWADNGPEETDAEQIADTLFNFGYDLINRVFLWNYSALDGLYDCTLENGDLTATYGEASEVIPVDNLEDEDGVVSFPNRPEDEVDPDLEPATEPVQYTGADGDCGLSGGEVTGPEGQVNHGMFLKLFNSLYDGDGFGRGCLVRHIAQSDLGKGDQQIEVGEESDFESVEAGDTGVIDVTSIETDCEKVDRGTANGENGNGEGNGRPESAGKPDNVGRPDSPGNSGSAPGHDN